MLDVPLHPHAACRGMAQSIGAAVMQASLWWDFLSAAQMRALRQQTRSSAGR